MIDACILLLVAVLSCDPRAQTYATAAARVPPDHWALVGSVRITSGTHGRAHGPLVSLPSPARPLVLYHEVGHLVARTNGLQEVYTAAFWRNGQAHGRTTRYGRTSPSEDFADCYADLLSGGHRCGKYRHEWLRTALSI